jgi:hypothetical protein
MPWYEVVIPKNDVANENAAGLMSRCGRALLESGAPSCFLQAYQGRNDRWERVFYFYFTGSLPDLMAEVLEEFGASPCPQPDLKHFTEIKFP